VTGELRWSSTWENDLDEDAHAELAGLLARCFPRSPRLGGTRSWSGGRPELRLCGRLDGRPVAHLGILRRHLRVAGAETDVLVGDVGLVAVDPDVQGGGLGRRLLAEANGALDRLRMPFGFLTCGEQVAGFYAAGGWRRVTNPTRTMRADGKVEVYGGASMVLPVWSGMAGWPGGLIDRNGYEV
jgi:nodulation protein A